MAPSASMQSSVASDIWISASTVGATPSPTSASANSGTAEVRHSHANRSNIGTPCARRSRRLPMAKLIGEIISTAKTLTLKS